MSVYYISEIQFTHSVDANAWFRWKLGKEDERQEGRDSLCGVRGRKDM